MNAVEFIRKHGWKEARSVCNGIFTGCVTYKWVELNTDDLKRYVDAYELVQDFYGLDKAKEYADSPYTAPEIAEPLKQAIALVEQI